MRRWSADYQVETETSEHNMGKCEAIPKFRSVIWASKSYSIYPKFPETSFFFLFTWASTIDTFVPKSLSFVAKLLSLFPKIQTSFEVKTAYLWCDPLEVIHAIILEVRKILLYSQFNINANSIFISFKEMVN